MPTFLVTPNTSPLHNITVYKIGVSPLAGGYAQIFGDPNTYQLPNITVYKIGVSPLAGGYAQIFGDPQYLPIA